MRKAPLRQRGVVVTAGHSDSAHAGPAVETAPALGHRFSILDVSEGHAVQMADRMVC
jgi:glycerol uptake facilitator-like aquaporin